jgi:hypothetical protein
MSITGGCMCGQVRYELKSQPFDAGWCHCRTCQLSSGAPGMVFASVPDGDLVWTRGGDKVKSVPSSSFGHREFCGDCGTPFLMKVDHQPETVDFSVATLDGSGCRRTRLSHLLGQQDRLVRAERRSAAPRQVPAGYARFGRNRTAHWINVIPAKAGTRLFFSQFPLSRE